MAIKTNMTMCPQGHYYNAAKHSSCPLCAAEGGAAVSGTEMPGENTGSFNPTIDPEQAYATPSVIPGGIR